MKINRPRKEMLAVLTAVLSFPLVAIAGTKPSPVTAAPTPPQISSAKRIFISYAGGDERWYEDPIFTGGLDRTYNEFYAAMKAWGRYELAASPSDADLIVEIGMSTPAIAGAASEGDTIARKPYDPQFQLRIRDPKTNSLLWAFTEHVQWAILQGNRDKNFEATLNRIIEDMQALAGDPMPAPEAAPKVK